MATSGTTADPSAGIGMFQIPRFIRMPGAQRRKDMGWLRSVTTGSAPVQLSGAATICEFDLALQLRIQFGLGDSGSSTDLTTRSAPQSGHTSRLSPEKMRHEWGPLTGPQLEC